MLLAIYVHDGSGWARGKARLRMGTSVGKRKGTRIRKGGGCDPCMDTLGPRRAGIKWRGGGPFVACPAVPAIGHGWKVIPRTRFTATPIGNALPYASKLKIIKTTRHSIRYWFSVV